ncbi:hypothetical protein PROFUN_00280 [Planoprotostelium fungivorum]|uniref:Uncharacterized protein n=1 Tax=Planoprotostelium fungivorum TaxID=1890364 RepID=A0A2P6NXZ1_9EUKA|nr:hypothetical protein PROFUN_00280 [Planoprotostelium fungivorum]
MPQVIPKYYDQVAEVNGLTFVSTKSWMEKERTYRLQQLKAALGDDPIPTREEIFKCEVRENNNALENCRHLRERYYAAREVMKKLENEKRLANLYQHKN